MDYKIVKINKKSIDLKKTIRFFGNMLKFNDLEFDSWSGVCILIKTTVELQKGR